LPRPRASRQDVRARTARPLAQRQAAGPCSVLLPVWRSGSNHRGASRLCSGFGRCGPRHRVEQQGPAPFCSRAGSPGSDQPGASWQRAEFGRRGPRLRVKQQGPAPFCSRAGSPPRTSNHLGDCRGARSSNDTAPGSASSSRALLRSAPSRESGLESPPSCGPIAKFELRAPRRRGGCRPPYRLAAIEPGQKRAQALRRSALIRHLLRADNVVSPINADCESAPFSTAPQPFVLLDTPPAQEPLHASALRMSNARAERRRLRFG